MLIVRSPRFEAIFQKKTHTNLKQYESLPGSSPTKYFPYFQSGLLVNWGSNPFPDAILSKPQADKSRAGTYEIDYAPRTKKPTTLTPR